ncbi:hypothetical protein QE152_g41162, partial [Popillia japonica]
DGQTDTQALATNKENLEANLEEALVFGRRSSLARTPPPTRPSSIRGQQGPHTEIAQKDNREDLPRQDEEMISPGVKTSHRRSQSWAGIIQGAESGKESEPDSGAQEAPSLEKKANLTAGTPRRTTPGRSAESGKESEPDSGNTEAHDPWQDEDVNISPIFRLCGDKSNENPGQTPRRTTPGRMKMLILALYSDCAGTNQMKTLDIRRAEAPQKMLILALYSDCAGTNQMKTLDIRRAEAPQKRKEKEIH